MKIGSIFLCFLLFVGLIILPAGWGHVDAADNSPFVVLSTSPEGECVGVATDTPISVIFSEAMDASTFTVETFHLYGADNTPVPGKVRYDADTKTVYFIPEGDLFYSTIYRAVLASGVKDEAGNVLTSEYTWSFTTMNNTAGCGGG